MSEDMRVRCTCGETACESELCDCDSIPCPVNHRAERAEAERDAAHAAIAQMRAVWSEWRARLGGAFPPAMVHEMDAALDASSAPESTESEEAEETDAVSDGYHTFGELYDHRRALTAALAKALNLDSWRSKAHHPDDSPMFEGGYFIVGINLPTGTITYHYKLSHWDDFAGVIELAHAPKWDGAPPAASVDRLLAWASAPETRMRPVSVESPGNDGFPLRAHRDTPWRRPMKLMLPMDPNDPLCRRLVVDGRQVGLVSHDFGGWTAGLWPIADRRPRLPFGGETINQATLADLRFALHRRLDQGGSWWTADAPESPQEDS